jgi:hypothetical protein
VGGVRVDDAALAIPRAGAMELCRRERGSRTQPKESAMSMTDARSSDPSGVANVKNVDLKLEVVVIPVSDVDRAKEF